MQSYTDELAQWAIEPINGPSIRAVSVIAPRNGAKVKLSRAVTYGIQATVELARADPDRRVSSRELARRGDMPERFLLQILRSLVSGGVLRSYHGVSGGYKLARAPDRITLLDIIDSIDSPDVSLTPTAPVLSTDLRQRIELTLAETWEVARVELNKLTIADLVGREPNLRDKPGRHTTPK